MKRSVHVRLGDGGPEADDDAGGCVVFDADDPESVESARAELSRLLGGRPVPTLFGRSEPRAWVRGLRRLLRGRRRGR